MTQHTPRTDRELVDAMRSLPPERAVNEYDCGCKVMRESAGAYFIRYCPTHAAAPERLEALETLAQWPRSSSNADGVMSNDPAVGLANVRRYARAAIAKATA